MNAVAFVPLAALDAQAPRLEGAHAAGDDDGAGIKAGAAAGGDIEAAIRRAPSLRSLPGPGDSRD